MPFIWLIVTLAVVYQWLPMHIGDRWTYEGTVAGGDKKHPRIDRWRQEETTFAIQNIPEGLLIRRKVRIIGDAEPPSYLAVPSESNILIRNNCAYYLNGSLTADFRKTLAADEALPDVCFPPHLGQVWGHPGKPRDSWTVTGMGRKNADDPPAVTPKCWRVEANLSSGDDNYHWFERGVGMVAERTYHNGSYADFCLNLIDFQPRH